MSDEDSTVPPAPYQRGGRRGKKLVHVAGTVYGSWTLISEGEPTPRSVTRWWCRCDCGHEQLNTVANLIQGASKSCGECQSRLRARRVGYAVPPESIRLTRSTWTGMKHRCLNPKCHAYTEYGGRGISVCDRWRVSFDNFLDDMGVRPGREFSIDRIDGTGNYDIGNCRWATSTEQARNMKSNVILQLGDQAHCISEWAEILGIPASRIGARISSGKSVEESLKLGRVYKYGVRATPPPPTPPRKSLAIWEL